MIVSCGKQFDVFMYSGLEILSIYSECLCTHFTLKNISIINFLSKATFRPPYHPWDLQQKLPKTAPSTLASSCRSRETPHSPKSNLVWKRPKPLGGTFHQPLSLYHHSPYQPQRLLAEPATKLQSATINLKVNRRKPKLSFLLAWDDLKTSEFWATLPQLKIS